MDKHLSELDSRLALVQQQVNELLLKQRALDETFYPPSRIRNEPFERPFEIVPLMVMLWAGTEANIPGGWALMDGSANSVGNGGSGIDLSGRFVVQIDPDGSSGRGTYAVGATGGFRWHGATENNHNDHNLVHDHEVAASPSATQCAAAAVGNPLTDVYAYVSSPSYATVTGCINWTGTDSAPTKLNPAASGSDFLAKHIGPYNSNQDTDNRPPYYALCYIERLP